MLLSAVFIGLAGIAGVYLRLRREFSRGVTLVAIVLVAAATPLTWYVFLEPSLFEIAAFALTAWLAVAATSPNQTAPRPRAIARAAWVVLCAAPIAIVWWTTVRGGGLDPSLSRWSDVLFSSRRGFLSWTPVVYVAVVGTILYAGRSRAWAISAIAMLLAAAWLVGSSERWLHDASAGSRPLIVLLALLAPGLAHFIDLVRRRPVLALAPLVALPLLWNYLLMVQYTIGLLPKDEPISFARMVRQQADLQARSTPIYPFAFPANVWFAWRERVPVDRYDTLGVEPLVGSLDLPLDRTAERFLLDGWSGPTAEGEGQGWWIGARQASLALPLRVEPARPARISLVARSRYEEPVVEADLAVLVNGHEVGTFSPPAADAREASFSVPATALRSGLNIVSIVTRGTHRVDPADSRPPGPLARRAARSAWPVAVYRVTFAPL